MKPQFYPTPVELRKWLEKNHGKSSELWVGFYKRKSRKPSITWPEAVDQALCYGWIDGVRKSLGDESYVIRFTPRQPNSIWSAVNIKRAKELSRLDRMRPAGLAAFAARRSDKEAIYSYEQRKGAALAPEQQRQFRANEKAWAFFQAKPPWYRRTATYWVISAKKEETRAKRLATLIKDSQQGRTIAPLTRPGK